MTKRGLVSVFLLLAACNQVTLDDRLAELGMTPCPGCGTFVPVGQQNTQNGFQENPWFVNGVIAVDLPDWESKSSSGVKAGIALANSDLIKGLAEATAALGGSWSSDAEVRLRDAKLSRAVGFAPINICDPNYAVLWIKESIAANGCEASISTTSLRLNLGIDTIRVDDLLQRAANRQASSTGTSPSIRQAVARCNSATDVNQAELPDMIATADAAKREASMGVSLGVSGATARMITFNKSTTLGYRAVRLRCTPQQTQDAVLKVGQGTWLQRLGVAVTIMDRRQDQLLVRVRRTADLGNNLPDLANFVVTSDRTFTEVVPGGYEQEWRDARECGDVNRLDRASCKVELPAGSASIFGFSVAQGGGYGTIVLFTPAPTFGEYRIYGVRQQYTEAN